MAIKPTIYKANISLSDLDRDYYDSLRLTIAKHPSETIERMMVRIMAFCINADEHISFTKGISEVEEPDLWIQTLDDQIALWIDVGEPAFDRIKKASRISTLVKVYSFNLKADIWWQQNNKDFDRLDISVYQFQWDEIQALTNLVQRTMNFSVTITANSAFVAGETGECEVSWEVLQDFQK